MIMGFIDTMRAQGHAVESVCRVLREQGCQVAARTYRAWRGAHGRVAARTVSDALVQDAVRGSAWTIDARGARVLAPEGLYGRRKMTAHLRLDAAADASRGAVDRAMRALGLAGVRRDKHLRTTVAAKDGIRATDLLNRQLTAPAPNNVWVTDIQCRRRHWIPPTYLVFGASAVKSRPSRSGTFWPSGSGTVVRTRRRSRIPAM